MFEVTITDHRTDFPKLSAQGYAPVPEFYTGAWANVGRYVGDNIKQS